ncbi:GNAT family N-acetyltransferase [Novosphingobium sp. TH158]|uniref:GNAT family N-acetyltransferase n=1 Tax=Novosphingobium sp. TH158 TaxID=2067455 RepID=UPI000C7B0FC0|nr:GNAT family N-acetyltransferase [Novosphingobium sp. TH158]PLK24237.1 hypothetical protein C0V78_13245 [Novosphingobium sp. TH158]
MINELYPPPPIAAEKLAPPVRTGAGNSIGGAMHLRLVDPHRIDPADEAQWDDLGHNRSGDSVFAEPWLMRISLAHCDRDKRAVLAVVVDIAGKWLGVLPVHRSWRHGRAIWPNLSSWQHANQFNGTPLVRAGYEVQFWRGLLAGVDRTDGPAVSLCMQGLPADDPANEALVRVLAEEGRSWRISRRYSRACIHADRNASARAEAAFKPKLRRRLESLERQLGEEVGDPVHLHSSRDPEVILQLIGRFLAIEAAGWKGSAGSALDRDVATRAFFTQAAHAAAVRGRFEVSWLEAAGQCIAMTTQFIGSEWSCGFKRAHDEKFARFAPGQLLLKNLTRLICERGEGHFDSSASPDQESINRMWPDRRELFDCHIAIGGRGRRLVHGGLSGLQSLWHAVKPVR